MVEHLYLHVPFCASICHYCDFCHRLYNPVLVKQWLEALKKEIETYNIKACLKTIYIGGGTPSCLSEKELIELLECLKPLINNVEEFSFEANPESLNPDKIKILKQYGVNRISLGVQAIQESLLKLMNRNHSFADVKQVVSWLKKVGIDNISLDLMYSLPGQTLDNFKASLEAVTSLDIKHISIYSLTIEEHSVFGKKGYQPCDDETEADMYQMAIAYLETKGFKQYEIANFAKESCYSKHNMAYWNYNDFYGLSLGASGKLGDYRYDNTKSFKKYFAHDFVEERIDLSHADLMFENIMMALRTKFGLDLSLFERRYHQNFFEVYKKPYEKHIDDFEITDGFLRVKDLAVLNSLLIDFLD